MLQQHEIRQIETLLVHHKTCTYNNTAILKVRRPIFAQKKSNGKLRLQVDLVKNKQSDFR